MIVTGSQDGTAKLWNASDGTVLRTFSGHSGFVKSVTFSPDGKKVLTGSYDGTARLWQALVNAGDKFILVAGGGNYIGNPIVAQTQALADRVLFTCQVRGYRLDEIQYLSAFNDWATRDSNEDGLPDADAAATTQTFWAAIDVWALDAARLFIYLIDHGDYSSQKGDYYFRLNATPQYIWARDLDAHLDALQNRTGCEVIVIVDCCRSGGFVQRCTAPTGKRRTVIASTTPQALAVFSPPDGAESFSFYFFSFAIVGRTLEDCFDRTRVAFQGMGNPAGQVPWMDDNNDGVSNKSDGALAARSVLGRYPAFGLNPPSILAVAPGQRALVDRSVTLWATLDEASDTTVVWAVIVPPGGGQTSGGPVTDLTRVNLTYNSALKRWQAAWSPQAKHTGQCTVTYFAMSQDSLGTRLLAEPVSSALMIGDTSVRLPWSLLK
jgi:hypothetical protein